MTFRLLLLHEDASELYLYQETTWLVFRLLLKHWHMTGPGSRFIVLSRALGYLAGGKHSEFLQLFSSRKRADLGFLLAGPLLLTQAWSGRVAAPGSGVRVGSCRAAGLRLLKPGLRGGLCRRVRHISSLTSPPRIAELTSTLCRFNKVLWWFSIHGQNTECACALRWMLGNVVL